MSFFRRLRDRLVKAPSPPKCPACRQDEIPLEALGGDRWLCPVCAKDFLAVREGDTWRCDLTPRRYQQRRLSA